MNKYKQLFEKDVFDYWYTIVHPIKDLDLYSVDTKPTNKYEVGLINKNKNKYNKNTFGIEEFSKLFKKNVIDVQYYKDGTIFLKIKR